MLAMYKRYENKKPCGVYGIGNFGGLALFNPDEIDKYNERCDFIAAFHNGTKYTNFHKHKVHYTLSGRAYIRKGGVNYYLDEIMRLWERTFKMSGRY